MLDSILEMLKNLARRFSSFTNSFTTGVWAIPAPEKKARGGEDAYLTNSKLIAIADGVGGWAEMGINPAKYAWELMNNVEKAFSSLSEDQKYYPQEVMKQAADSCKETGSSTCSIAVLHPEKSQLLTANIGDSGFYLYRKEGDKVELVGKSEEVLHSFNFPYQLGTHGDSTKEASLANFEVKDKDLVVMYTDGISDNVYQEQIYKLIKPFMLLPEIPDLEIVAEMIAEKAQQQSSDKDFESPFAVSASKSGFKWQGGKPDDITVIVAQVHIKKLEDLS